MEREYKREVLEELLKDPAWEKQRSTFSRLLGKPIWWIAEDNKKDFIYPKKGKPGYKLSINPKKTSINPSKRAPWDTCPNP